MRHRAECYPQRRRAFGSRCRMIALAELTKPGPFVSRTHELGMDLGIRQSGRLVAMEGERLQFDGFTETSAVCTHPQHSGRGHAQTLVAGLLVRIAERGETAFPHVRADNHMAFNVYQKLGFETRRYLHLAVLQIVSSDPSK